MNLLKVGRHIVNADLIQTVHISEGDDEIVLHTLGGPVSLQGKEASVLRHWLIKNAVDLMPEENDFKENGNGYRIGERSKVPRRTGELANGRFFKS